MIVKFRATTVQEMDIDPCEAFRILCLTLDVEPTWLDNDKLCVKHGPDGERHVYQPFQDRYELFDDRGELFDALRRLAELVR